MAEAPRLKVSVVYAEVDKVFDAELSLPAGATVGDAIEKSRIRECKPDIEIRFDRIGIFSRKAVFDTGLRDGDRVEIYRPLKVDPKEARRKRARDA
ncbi:MAG: RnfH family protein [Rhodanobacteraceae bacterium]